MADVTQQWRGQVIMNKKLKSCPFCGGIAEIFTGYSGCEKVYRVECTQCRGRSLESEIKATVIDAWNRREETR